MNAREHAETAKRCIPNFNPDYCSFRERCDLSVAHALTAIALALTDAQQDAGDVPLPRKILGKRAS